jgi:hypothetical protein
MAVDSHIGQFSQAFLTKLVDPNANFAIVGFWRTLPDGSIEKFELPFGHDRFRHQFLMTEVDDPQGNAVKISYDNHSEWHR